MGKGEHCMNTKTSLEKLDQDEVWEQRFQELKKKSLNGIAIRSGYTVEIYFNPFIRPNRFIDLRTDKEIEEDKNYVPF
jgi:hypothetical protein